MRPVKSALAATITWIFATAGGTAQEAPPIDPPEVVQRREEHLREMQRASIPVYQAYLRKLEPLKAQYSREGKYDALTALQNEIKRVQRDLDAATAAATRNNALTLQFTILSATYGVHDKNKTIDITETLRKALRAGAKQIKLNTQDGAGGKDPAPFAPKATVITYTINGQRKEKTFPEGQMLNFKDDLN